MGRSSKRNISAAILILLSITMLLSACGGGGANAEGTPSDDPGFVYVPEYISLPSEITSMERVVIAGDLIYFTSYGKTGEREPGEGEPKPGDEYYYEGMYDVYSNAMYKMKIDGTGLEKLNAYVPQAIPEGSQGSSDLASYAVCEDGSFWIAENLNLYSVEENGKWKDGGSSCSLRKVDADGTELCSVDLTPYAQEGNYFYIGSMLTDGRGNICFTDGNQNLFVMDTEGKLLFKLSEEYGMNSLARLADGSIAVSCYGQSGMTLKTVDMETKAFGKNIELPFNVYNVLNGGGEYDVYYRSESALIGYNFSSKEETKLVNWISADINSNNLNAVAPLQDGRILCTMTNYNMGYMGVEDMAKSSSNNFEIVILTKRDSSAVEKKKIITLAAMWLDYNLRGEIINFNKTNGTYRIEVTDYSEFNTQEDYSAGITKLSTEIISGEVPDILCTNQLPVDRYAAKGLLENLYPYIDADEQLGGRGGLMQPVLSAMEYNGNLYEISPSFYVFTVLGAPDVVGEKMGWTMDELNAVIAANPGAQAFAEMTRESMLYYITIFGLEDYVNWETGECSFNSDSFIKMLEFIKTFPEEIKYDKEEYVDIWQLIAEGKVLLYPMSISDFNQYQMYKAMFGGEVTFKGFPTSNGTGSVFSVDTSIAMSSKCSDKEGAWQFMRMLLTEEYQEKYYSWNFPTNKKCFDKKVTEAMTPETYTDENGKEVEVPKNSWGWGGTPVETFALSQEEADQIMELINSVKSTMSYDENLLEIVKEGAAAFFAGQKTAADAANVIQSRVSIYVNEQR